MANFKILFNHFPTQSYEKNEKKKMTGTENRTWYFLKATRTLRLYAASTLSFNNSCMCMIKETCFYPSFKK
jgi:hypothetical protein